MADIIEIKSDTLSSKFFEDINTNFNNLKEETVFKDGTVTTDKIVNDAVTTDKIADGAVTTDKIQNGAITTDKIKDSAVTNNKIASGAITKEKLNEKLQAKIDQTQRIFIVYSMPTPTNKTITDIYGNTFTPVKGDIVVLIKQ